MSENKKMDYPQKMKSYLSDAPNEDWMFVACDINYDEGFPVIEWMVSQPRCPQAAALAIYWLMSPTIVKMSDTNTFEIDRRILATIEENFPDNYESTNLGFNPQHDTFADSQGYDWTQGAADTQLIPEKMRTVVEGEKLSYKDPRFAEWIECSPPELLK